MSVWQMALFAFGWVLLGIGIGWLTSQKDK